MRLTDRPVFAQPATLVASAALLLPAALSAFPFVWMIFATFKTNFEIFTPLPLWPKTFHFDYYRQLLDGRWIPFGRNFVNTLVVACAQTAGALCLVLPAGFAFATYKFRGDKVLYGLAILVLVLPRQVLALPLFTWLHRLSLLDTLLAVILPGLVSGIGVLYFTQVFRRLPREVLDLARSEGAGEFRAFLTILPLVKPAILTYGLLHFILAWHEHLIPLIVLHSKPQLTVSVALSSLYGSSMRIPYAMLMVGSLFACVPTSLLYLAVHRHFRSALAQLTAR